MALCRVCDKVQTEKTIDGVPCCVGCFLGLAQDNKGIVPNIDHLAHPGDLPEFKDVPEETPEPALHIDRLNPVPAEDKPEPRKVVKRKKRRVVKRRTTWAVKVKTDA